MVGKRASQASVSLLKVPLSRPPSSSTDDASTRLRRRNVSWPSARVQMTVLCDDQVAPRRLGPLRPTAVRPHPAGRTPATGGIKHHEVRVSARHSTERGPQPEWSADDVVVLETNSSDREIYDVGELERIACTCRVGRVSGGSGGGGLGG